MHVVVVFFLMFSFKSPKFKWTSFYSSNHLHPIMYNPNSNMCLLCAGGGGFQVKEVESGWSMVAHDKRWKVQTCSLGLRDRPPESAPVSCLTWCLQELCKYVEHRAELLLIARWQGTTLPLDKLFMDPLSSSNQISSQQLAGSGLVSCIFFCVGYTERDKIS